MAEETWENARGLCEWSEINVPMGTAPAHIIPRAAGKVSSDEAWNLALLSPARHTEFDTNRPAALEKMRKQGGCRLSRRIEEDPRLRAYFDRLTARRDYITGDEEKE